MQESITLSQKVDFPKLITHKISIKYKFLFIGIYLISLPFCTTYIIISQHAMCFVLSYLQLTRYDVLRIVWLKLSVFLYSLYIIAGVLTKSSNMTYRIPYTLMSTFTPPLHGHIYFCLPHILTRSFTMVTNYYMIYSIIQLTTSGELILLYINKTINHLPLDMSTKIKTKLLVLTSYELVNTLKFRLNCTITSCSLRGLNSSRVIYYWHKLFFLALVRFNHICDTLIVDTMHNMYFRNLLYYDQELWFVV
uniref:Uncharacterized protein n=1 Tax=Yamadaella caenomyce TaxID=259029 RepID=A0A1G4NYQ5_9FLOR|nr:Hypothetical protein ORF_5 [Yamadaella caenomyce]SCW23787.1 Hypothetical protein ORF_5 [Yamadaella caenomyce]